MAVPIWKDYFVDLGQSGSMPYRVRVGGSSGDIIYSGVAHRRPGETRIGIRINDIAADYIGNTLPELSQAAFSDLSFPLAFLVEKYTGAQWSSVETVSFLNDWSYDYDYNAATMGMAFPVNGRVDARQWIVFTALDASSVTATITFRDGTTSTVIIPVEISDDFNADFNADFARSARAAGSGTAVFDLSEWQDVASLTVGGVRYDVVTDCGVWAFYYVNAYGGWDTFLIEGGSAVRDELTRRLRKVEYDNRSASARGTRNYVNELSRVFTFHTSWLSDAESARMHHLLNSTEVYLYEINTGRMMPVTVNGNTTNYKTYRSNGCKLVNYDIEVTLAQDMTRR